MKQTQITVRATGRPEAIPLHCRLIGDETVNLTFAKAEQYIDYLQFSGERAVRENHVQYLLDEYLTGRFVWNLVTIVVGILIEGGKREVYRLNGQHVCWMRINIPKDKETGGFKVRQLIYECKTVADLRELYASIDRGAPRSKGHVTKVMLADVSGDFGLPVSSISKLTVGMRVWLWEDEKKRSQYGTPQEISRLVRDQYSDLYRVVGGFFQQNYTGWKHIGRSAIVAALFATFGKSAAAAPEFWNPVCTGLNLTDKHDPRWQLRNFVESHRSRPGAFGGDNLSVGTEELYRVAIQLWNKWRQKDKVYVVRTTDTRTKVL